MKDRIRQFLDRENKSSSQFAEKIGVQPSAVSHVLSGRNKPSLDFVLKMLTTYTYLNTEWLLFGRGEMYKNKEEPDLFQYNRDESANNDSEKAEIGKLFDTQKGIKEIVNGKIGKSGYENVDTDVKERFSERIIIFYPDGTYSEYNRRK